MSSQTQYQAANAIRPETVAYPPYAPSFVDRFRDAVERLPIPYALTYLALFILQSGAMHVVAWFDGWLPSFTFSPLLLIFPLWMWGPFAIMTYLDSISLRALSYFSPLLDIPPETMERLRYEFTTMPARGVMVSSLVWSGCYLLFSYVSVSLYADYRLGMFFSAILFVEGWITFVAGGAIYYHSLRQLSLVNRTVRLVNQFGLFRLDPVYAFSVVTSRTGVAWVLLLTSTLILYPIQLAPLPAFATLVVQVVLAMAAFVLPLWIVHTRLAAEKRVLLAENHRRVESILARLHSSVDRSELSEVDEYNGAITGLNAEREILSKIPTWPWRTGVLTGFLSVIALPIITFLIQYALGKWLIR